MTVAGRASLFDLGEVDRLLTTTRSVRRRLDVERPVPAEVVREALELAVQAPTAQNLQHWRWIVITEEKVRLGVAEQFRQARWLDRYRGTRSRRGRREAESRRLQDSADSVVELIAKVPVLVVPCMVGRPPDIGRIDAEWTGRGYRFDPDDIRSRSRMGAMMASNFYGSIYPAIWSFQLALRSRGLGSTITCMNLMFPGPFAELLGIPEVVTPICVLPVAYTVGTDFRPAPRVPAGERTFWNRWGIEEAP
ncbi:nitroreductase family protein [Nonomuraea longispora]|uniref:Nitroreductase family protein n=1 Tax=Nonomuraea longispora TaxID=1848320 RepID=A0A4R4N5D0_9ACTN|nr:nitroreductase family protein [Nonomuraea longispora]TDC04031.1 nitroreductase family protein [Nonomuraea longispora]